MCHELNAVTNMAVVSYGVNVLASARKEDLIQHSDGLFVTSSSIQTFVAELSFYACSLSDHLMEEKKLGVCTGFASFDYEIIENFSRLDVLKDSRMP